MADKIGVFNRLGYATSGTTASLEFEFMEGSSLGLSEQFIDANALRGTRSHGSERVRRGTRRADGSLIFCPSPVELDTILYLALGTQKSGSTIALAETLPTADWFAVRDGTVWHYDDCVVETLSVSASEGGPLQCALTVVGKDEVQEGSMGSAAIEVASGGPFILADGVVSVGGTNYQFSSFELTVQNVLEVKYRNSLTPTSIRATDRIVTVSLPFDQGDYAALYGATGPTGAAVVATFTNGAVSMAFNMAKVATPRQPLPFGQRGILDLPWSGVARKSGSTLELVTTVDSTP